MEKNYDVTAADIESYKKIFEKGYEIEYQIIPPDATKIKFSAVSDCFLVYSSDSISRKIIELSDNYQHYSPYFYTGLWLNVLDYFFWFLYYPNNYLKSEFSEYFQNIFVLKKG